MVPLKHIAEALKKTIEDNSGKVLSGVSAKVDYLVAGDKMGPEKTQKQRIRSKK